MKFIDLTGKRFGKLVCTKRGPNSLTATRWYCRCDCGVIKLILARALRGGLTISCGCRMLVSNLKHGHTSKGTRSKEYKAWHDMKARCLNKTHKSYSHYGARGITISKEWLTFLTFYKDMGNSPKGYMLDRINNNGNYCKENCKWSSPKESANNRRPKSSCKSNYKER